MKYAVIIAYAGNNYSAYAPDLPGCVSVGDTIEETEKNIKEAIEFHLDGMRTAGLAIPMPSAVCEYVEVAADLFV